MIIPLQWAMYYDTKYWTDPHIYQPKRFLDDDGTIINHKAFMPFQAGYHTVAVVYLVLLTLTIPFVEFVLNFQGKGLVSARPFLTGYCIYLAET